MKPKRRMDDDSTESTEEDKGEAQIAQLETAFLKETLKELGNIFFMGEVNEEAANGLVSSLITYKELIEKSAASQEEEEELEESPEVSVEAVEGEQQPAPVAEEPQEEEEDEEEEVEEEPKEPDPIKLYISTQGGNADDMFAIYDVIELVKRTVPIQTIGLGKVMSAGVLLLAAGTKGKRKIARHARVMIHNVITGHSGGLFHVANELGEAENIQQMYINAIAENSNLTVKQLRRMVKTGQNIYLSAEEAIKYGIADELM